MDYYKLKVLNHKKIIIVIIFIIISLIIAYYYFYYEKNPNDTIIKDNEVNSDTMISSNLSNSMIYVDIKGYVAKPGVYSFKLEDDARINDLILKAGGLVKDADTSLINLSKKIEDEMTVIIYSKKEIENYIKEQDELLKKLELCEKKVVNNACIEKKVEDNNQKININTASEEELKNIPGIGDSKAESIINYRNTTPFKQIEDIKNVEGIGENLFENIKEYLTI